MNQDMSRDELVSLLESELKNLDEDSYPHIKRLVESGKYLMFIFIICYFTYKIGSTFVSVAILYLT